VIGYRVYRSETSGSGFSALNGTTITALNYTDSTVSSGTTYYYVVTSVNSSGVESAYSNQATAVVP
jgi:fibronectin type 3 domain-containing protein